MKNVARFRDFVQSLTRLMDAAGSEEPRMLEEGSQLLAELVGHHDWLPDQFAKPHSDHYEQYLLYCDPMERFSVVSFVWGPGHYTPVHDHTVWGLVGVMRGAERCIEFGKPADGSRLEVGDSHLLMPGEVDQVSPRIGDIHKVSNAVEDDLSISIHVYGANIGAVRRHIYDPDTGVRTSFVSGYSSSVIPNIWDRSLESV